MNFKVCKLHINKPVNIKSDVQGQFSKRDKPFGRWQERQTTRTNNNILQWHKFPLPPWTTLADCRWTRPYPVLVRSRLSCGPVSLDCWLSLSWALGQDARCQPPAQYFRASQYGGTSVTGDSPHGFIINLTKINMYLSTVLAFIHSKELKCTLILYTCVSWWHFLSH